MGDTGAVRTDVRTVFFLKGDWSLVELQDGRVAILHHGQTVNGHDWPVTAMGKAVEAFRQISKSTGDAAGAKSAPAEARRAT